MLLNWEMGFEPREDPLEEGIATHSSILASRTPSTEEPGKLEPMGLQSQTQLKSLSTHKAALPLQWQADNSEEAYCFFFSN